MNYEVLLKKLLRWCKENEYEVTGEESYKECLDAFAGESPDIIISELGIKEEITEAYGDLVRSKKFNILQLPTPQEFTEDEVASVIKELRDYDKYSELLKDLAFRLNW